MRCTLGVWSVQGLGGVKWNCNWRCVHWLCGVYRGLASVKEELKMLRCKIGVCFVQDVRLCDGEL